MLAVGVLVALHAVTLSGGLTLAASGPLRFLVSRTDEWFALAHGLVSLVQY